MGNQKPFCIPEYWDVRGTSLSSSYARQRFLSQQTMRVRHVSHVRTTKRTWTGSRKGRRHIDATVITQGSVVFLLEHLWPWHSLIPFLDLGPLDAAVELVSKFSKAWTLCPPAGLSGREAAESAAEAGGRFGRDGDR